MMQTAGSSVVHVLQQQHAAMGLLHGAAPEHTTFGVKFVPLICAHVPLETYEQTLLAGLQHAPGSCVAHTLAEQTLKPSHVPAFLMQSQLVAAMQLPFRQHLPYTGVVGQLFGVHVPPATYVEAPWHGCAAVTTKHVPVHGWQQTPVTGGQGFGVHDVTESDVVPAGHGVPSASVWHRPVEGLQHTWSERHGTTAAHGWPRENTPGVGQAVAPDTIAHAPVEVLQHAPCVPGGHGFGEHDVAVTSVDPEGQTVPLMIWQRPVMTLQHVTFGGGQGLVGTHVDPVPAQIAGAKQKFGLATIVQMLPPDADTVQHAPCVAGGHGFGEQVVADTEIWPVGHASPPPTIWQSPVATSQQITFGGTHGFTGTHVEPTPPHTPVHAVGPATMVHTLAPAAFTVQHAPFTGVGGGQGFVGRQVWPLDKIVPEQGVPSGTIVQLPSRSQQAYRFAIEGHGFGMHVVIVVLIVPLQLPGAYTIRQLLLISQQNLGGHGVGLHAA
jgi:hypothetical protein